MLSTTEDLQNENSATEKEINIKNRKRKIAYMLDLITIEPVVVLYAIAYAVRISALDNLQLEKACKATERFNETVCSTVTEGTYKEKNFTEQNNAVQLDINFVNAWSISLGCVITIIISVFLGAYSDSHKIRKPLMLSAIFGDFIANGGCELCAIFMQELPLELLFFFKNVIAAFFGNWATLSAAVFAYTTDVSTPETCTLRIAVLYGVIYITTPIGRILGGVLFNNTGYTTTLLLSSVMYLSAFLYAVFFVNEPKKKELNKRDRRNNVIADICNLSHATAPFKLLSIKGRKHITFLCILIALFIIYTCELGEDTAFFLFSQKAYQWTAVTYSYFDTSSTVMQTIGEDTAFFLFSQKAYQWTAVTYSYFDTSSTVMQTIGITVGIYIVKNLLKLNDLTITLVSLFDSLIMRTIFLFSITPVGAYAGILIGMIRGLSVVTLRAQSTKCVSEDDNGKAQSLIACIETLSLMAGGIVYNKGIYAYTESTFPHAIFILGIALTMLTIVFIILVYFVNKETAEQEKQENCT